MFEQIALIEAPIRDITDARTARLVQEIGRLDVLGNLCQVMSTGRQLEFWVGQRRYEISIEDLVQAAGSAIAGHLKGEIADRVRARMPEYIGVDLGRDPAEPAP